MRRRVWWVDDGERFAGPFHSQLAATLLAATLDAARVFSTEHP